MKLKIKEAGAFDGEGKEIPVGTIISADGDDVPGWLVGKGEVIADDPASDAEPVTNGKGKA